LNKTMCPNETAISEGRQVVILLVPALHLLPVNVMAAYDVVTQCHVLRMDRCLR
jgi:hypothetical protein